MPAAGIVFDENCIDCTVADMIAATNAIAGQPLKFQGLFRTMVLQGALSYEDGCRCAGYDLAWWDTRAYGDSEFEALARFRMERKSGQIP